jgi:hypothetical protein
VFKPSRHDSSWRFKINVRIVSWFYNASYSLQKTFTKIKKMKGFKEGREAAVTGRYMEENYKQPDDKRVFHTRMSHPD